MKTIEDWPYEIGEDGVIVRINKNSVTVLHVTEKYPPGAEPSTGYGSYVVLSDGNRQQSFNLKELRAKYWPVETRPVGQFTVYGDGSVTRGTRTWNSQDDRRTIINYTEDKRRRTVTLGTLRKQAFPEAFGTRLIQEIQTIQSLRARIAILEKRLNATNTDT
jgi:hypothetical protein